LTFFSPKGSTRGILTTLFDQFPKVLGNIGQYDSCAFISQGTGQFKPGPEANPTIGSVGQVEYVDEERVELVVNDKGQRTELKNAVEALKKAHPYEEVAYFVHRLEDL